MKTQRTLLVAAAVALAACSGPSITTPSGTLSEFQGRYSLQGVVADAITGVRLGGSDLKLYLIQGADVRSPARLNTESSDPLMGEYAFTGIPVDYNAGNKTYKLVAIKPGYQRFESDLTFVASSFSGVLDTVYNVIGNIYLFPIGVSAPSVTFTVTYNGKPVPNATVQLDPVTSQNSTTFNQADALAATGGLLASMSGTTNAEGKVVFDGTTLALGGAYQVQVLPVNFTDSAGSTVKLARFKAGTNVVVGVSLTEQRVALADLTPTTAPLYLAAASNLPVGQLSPTGTLAFTFNVPVTLVNPAGFSASVANTTGVLAAQPVTANLSADGLTLTLTPNFSTPIGAGDRGTTILYGDGTALVSPKDYPALTYAVFSLRFSDNSLPSGLVDVRAP